MDAGLRFLPKVSTREYSPEEMAATYTGLKHYNQLD
jgi:hypothetical protein